MILTSFLAFLVGCASIPEGSPEMKRRALSFTPPSGKAGIYIIATSEGDGIILDFQDFGTLFPRSFLFGLVQPGDHSLQWGDLVAKVSVKPFHFTAEADKNYYFQLRSSIWPGTPFMPLNEEDGQAYVRRLKLSGDNRFEIEQWRGRQ